MKKLFNILIVLVILAAGYYYFWPTRTVVCEEDNGDFVVTITYDSDGIISINEDGDEWTSDDNTLFTIYLGMLYTGDDFHEVMDEFVEDSEDTCYRPILPFLK